MPPWPITSWCASKLDSSVFGTSAPFPTRPGCMARHWRLTNKQTALSFSACSRVRTCSIEASPPVSSPSVVPLPPVVSSADRQTSRRAVGTEWRLPDSSNVRSARRQCDDCGSSSGTSWAAAESSPLHSTLVIVKRSARGVRGGDAVGAQHPVPVHARASCMSRRTRRRWSARQTR